MERRVVEKEGEEREMRENREGRKKGKSSSLRAWCDLAPWLSLRGTDGE
jgi:hypothetical protein